jgi:homoserine O-acetyltransferase/O-succinyltransferase
MTRWIVSALCVGVLGVGAATAADYPAPVQADVVIRNFRFSTGDVLPELSLHYRTLGQPRRDAQGHVVNAVLVLHGTTGSGAQFIRPEFAGELFGAGQPLDAGEFFIVIPDNIGHGQSSRPSVSLRGAFPKYGYRDMVLAQYRLLTEALGVNHLRLVIGTSMGGMHAWLWGETYPDFADALMPLASLPSQIAGRNRMWRKIAIDAIRTDPEWKNGAYTAQPRGLRTAAGMLALVGSNPALRLAESPTLADADRWLTAYVDNMMATADANDVLWALESSWDYDPALALATIRVPLLAVNFADDLVNPPELGVLERGITRVPRGKAVVVPFSEKTRGHGSHTIAPLWKHHLVELLATARR